MSLAQIKALTFDTGGTVLDWHSGFRDAFAAVGQQHGIERSWAALANDLRRRTMEATIDQDEPLPFNFDEAHRSCLDALLADEGLDAVFDESDRRAIAWDAPHNFRAWPDVRNGLNALRERHIVVSFTLLSYRLIINTSRRNGLVWDAVLSCEGLGVNKLLPEAYRRAAARLQLKPEACLMVACHPFDLDAAAKVGFRTALVRRPMEWGPDEETSDPPPGRYDIEVDDFGSLAASLQVMGSYIANPGLR